MSLGVKSWYYHDTWRWTAGTWGTGSWVLFSKFGPSYDDPWSAHGQTELMDSMVKVAGPMVPMKYTLTRRFRWTGTSWIREV